MGGDRPSIGLVVLDSVTVPPAWAGIDLAGTSYSLGATWFPRMGGDRPYDGEIDGPMFVVPSHGRG